MRIVSTVVYYLIHPIHSLNIFYFKIEMGLDHKFFQLSNGSSLTKHSEQISKWHIDSTLKGKKHICTYTRIPINDN